jgi:hypothetical protein
MIKLRTTTERNYNLIEALEHDRLAAHAYERAIEARIAEYESERGYQGDTLTNAAIKSLRGLQNEAAAILADLLKEAK